MRRRGPKSDIRPYEVVDQYGTILSRCWYKDTAKTLAASAVAYTESGELRKFKVVLRSKGGKK